MKLHSIRAGRHAIAVLSLLIAVAPVLGNASQNSDDELRLDIAKLDSFLSNRNLDSIEATIDKESAKWREKDRPSFILYMTKACSLLSSYDIGNVSRRGSLLSHYSISVLTSGDLPLEENVRFVEFILFVPFMMEETPWKTLRKQTAELSLAARRRVESSIDPTFDFDDRPFLNVPTPPGSGEPNGVSPEFIRDPKLRAEYEHAIAENSAKARRFNDQYWLKRNAPDFYKNVERYLINAYSRPPAGDQAELERLLAQYVDDNGVRARVLDEVSKGGQVERP